MIQKIFEPVERAIEVWASHSAARSAGWDHKTATTQGSAALHPGLYVAARYRGLLEGFPQIVRTQNSGKTLSGYRKLGEN